MLGGGQAAAAAAAATLPTHILEKPLYSSQALTSGGVELVSRVTGPRRFHCEGVRASGTAARRPGGRAHLLVFRGAAAPHRLQDDLGDTALLAAAVADQTPLAGPFHHL